MKRDKNIRSATCISDAIIPGQLISSTNTINDYLFSNMSVKNLNLCTKFPFQASDLFTPERFLIQPQRFHFSLFLLIRTWLISLIREAGSWEEILISNMFHILFVTLWLRCFSHLPALTPVGKMVLILAKDTLVLGEITRWFGPKSLDIFAQIQKY